MSYAEDTHHLAVRLAHLLAHPVGALDEAGYRQGLLARGVTLDVTREVYRELTRPRYTSTRRGMLATRPGMVVADPVTALAEQLAGHRRVPGPSASEALTASSATPTGEQWREAARSALLADHTWREGTLPSWSPSTAWAALADAAALTEAVVVLDHDLAAAARSLGHAKDAGVLQRSADSPLRVAAIEVQAVASFGPLTGVEVEVVSSRPAPGQIVPVARDGDLPAAQSRLFTALTRVRHLRPEHAVQVALGQARAAATIAAVLRAGPDEGVQRLAGALDQAARGLGGAAGGAGLTASLFPGDPRPLLQAGEITRHLTRPAHPADRDPAALVDFARSLPDVVAALFDVARRHTAHGVWLVPTPDAAMTWSPYGVGLWKPALLTTAPAALAGARQVREATATLGTGRSRPAPLPPPRAVLRDVLGQAHHQRPTLPPSPSAVAVRRRGL